MSATLPFPNRYEAGRALARALGPFRQPLVLAVPRGGVEVAAPVATALTAELDLLLTRKVGAPFDPELALGAVAPDGEVLFHDVLLERFGLTPRDLAAQVAEARRELGRRLRTYRGDRPEPQLAGREVIVVDDGIATGFTLKAGLAWVRRQAPACLVLAVPVAPPEVWQELEAWCDRGLCLATPEPFYAVGQFYQDFSAVDDARVINLLRENWALGRKAH